MKPDAQFPETRGQREIKLRGLDRQELAPIVAETICRAVVKRSHAYKAKYVPTALRGSSKHNMEYRSD